MLFSPDSYKIQMIIFHKCHQHRKKVACKKIDIRIYSYVWLIKASN